MHPIEFVASVSLYRKVLYWVTSLALAVGIGYLVGFVIGDVVFKPWNGDEHNLVLSFYNGLITAAQYAAFASPIVCCVLYNRRYARDSEYAYYNLLISPLVSVAAAVVSTAVLFAICWLIKAFIIVICVVLILGVLLVGSIFSGGD